MSCESLNVIQRIDIELARLIDIRNRIFIYKYIGCDVENYLIYLNQKIEELYKQRFVNYKMFLIELGELPFICFSECSCDCLNCDRLEEYL